MLATRQRQAQARAALAAAQARRVWQGARRKSRRVLLPDRVGSDVGNALLPPCADLDGKLQMRVPGEQDDEAWLSATNKRDDAVWPHTEE